VGVVLRGAMSGMDGVSWDSGGWRSYFDETIDRRNDVAIFSTIWGGHRGEKIKSFETPQGEGIGPSTWFLS